MPVFCPSSFHPSSITRGQIGEASWFFGSQREYEEFKVRINALVAKAQKTPDEGWTMQDGTPWPGNNPRDHPGMIQVGGRIDPFRHFSR